MHGLNPIKMRCGVLLALSVLLAACAGFGAPTDSATTSPTTKSEWPRELSSDDKDVMAALMAGEFAWQDGRSATAARHFARAAAGSDDAAIAEHATRVAVVAQEWDLARQGLARWRVLAPDVAEQIQADMALALGNQDPDTALIAIGKLLARGEDDGARLVGQALLASTSADTVVVVLQRLAERSDLPGGAESEMLLSQVAQQLQQVELAKRLATMAVVHDPDSAPARLWQGHVALRAGDKAAAAQTTALTS